MSSILVTGAAGFIGSHTCDQLLKEGHVVVGVDNLSTGHKRNLAGAFQSARFRLIEADVADEPQLDKIVAEVKPTAIIHLAALVSVPQSIADPATNFRLNVWATHVVAETARRHHVPRIVFASSAAVYGDAIALPLEETAAGKPTSPYGAGKLASEALLLGHAAAFGMTVRCQRYFNVYGPRQDPRSPYSGVISIFLDRCQRGEPVTIFGDGEQTRDFIYVEDVARANVIAATRNGLPTGIANICTGREVSLNRLASELQAQFGRSGSSQYEAPRAGDIRRSCGSPARARETLQFSAETSLPDGLRSLIDR